MRARRPVPASPRTVGRPSAVIPESFSLYLVFWARSNLPGSSGIPSFRMKRTARISAGLIAACLGALLTGKALARGSAEAPVPPRPDFSAVREFLRTQMGVGTNTRPEHVIHRVYRPGNHNILQATPDWFVRDAIELLERVRGQQR
jgi:hypothetical protein